MIVLHGVWVPAMDGVAAWKLAIWGEDSSLSVPQPKRGRKAAKPQTRPEPHPFAASTKELLRTLGTHISEVNVTGARLDSAVPVDSEIPQRMCHGSLWTG